MFLRTKRILFLNFFHITSLLTLTSRLSAEGTSPAEFKVVNAGDSNSGTGGSNDNPRQTLQRNNERNQLAARLQERSVLNNPAIQKAIRDAEQAGGGNISDKDVSTLLKTIDDEKAKSALSDFNPSSDPFSASSPSTFTLPSNSGATVAGGHGFSGGSSNSNSFEGFDTSPRPTQLTSNLKDFQSAFNDFSFTMGNISLSDKTLSNTRDSFVNQARDTLDMKRGQEKPLESNAVFRALSAESQKSLKPNFLGLVKNGATGTAPEEDVSFLKEIVKNTNFQSVALKVLGAENLKYLNYSTIGADLLTQKIKTGATYASLLKLTEGMGAGASPNQFVKDWLEAAKFISSNVYKASIKDAKYASKLAIGYSELDKIYKKLIDYKSLDLLNTLNIPMKIDLSKMSDASIITAFNTLRQSSKLKPKDIWNEDLRSNFDFFHKKLSEAVKEIAATQSKTELLAKFERVLQNNSVRAYWRIFDLPNYFKFRRSVGVLYFTESFKDFQESRSPATLAVESPLYSIVKESIHYVRSEEKRSLAKTKDEYSNDKKYLVQKLANDKYYPTLSEENN